MSTYLIRYLPVLDTYLIRSMLWKHFEGFFFVFIGGGAFRCCSGGPGTPFIGDPTPTGLNVKGYGASDYQAILVEFRGFQGYSYPCSGDHIVLGIKLKLDKC